MTAVIETADGQVVVDVDVEAVRRAGRHLRERRRLHRKVGREERQFRKLLRRHWTKALELYLLTWNTTNRLTACINSQYRSDAASSADYVFEALVSLQARACRVAHEIHVHQRAGVLAGALARCRTLHELAVMTRVIGEYGRKPEHADLAERFLLHEAVLAYGDAQRHNRHAAALGRDLFSEGELEELRSQRDALAERFGQHYLSPYGWANKLPRTDRNGRQQRNRPELADLIRLAQIGHLEPYFRWASHEIHADSTSARSATIEVDNIDMLIRSNTANLSEPASLALSLLHHCTTSLVMFGVPSRQLDFLNFVVELRAIAVLLERTNEALMAGEVSLQVATKWAMSSRLGKLRRRSVMYRLNYAASAASDRAGNDESDSDSAV